MADETPHMFTSFMDVALHQARCAAERAEVPVGACVVNPNSGVVVAQTGNRMRELNDPTAHAEVLAIRLACATLKQERLSGLDIYVTLEPCVMCAGAIAAARLGRVYFGAFDPKSGGLTQGARVFSHSQTHHKPEVYGGLAEAECASLLENFFGKRRDD